MVFLLVMIGGMGVEGYGQTWQIGFNFSPDYCNAHNVNTNASQYPSVTVYKWPSEEIPEFGFTMGINLNHKLEEHFYFGAGVQYSNKTYKEKEWGLMYATYPGKGLYWSWSYQRTLSYYVFDFPLWLNFITGNKGLQLILGAGLTFNYCAEGTVYYNYKDLVGNPNFLNPSQGIAYFGNTQSSFNLSPTISLGLIYYLNDKINLRIEPTYRYGLRDINDASNLNSNYTEYYKTYIWNFGINCSRYFDL